ncbi:MAG: YitT family protein [Ruminococcaceae bacterium]|nr:YitT family protein [Oscillospiraceae bacterium]
MEAVRDGVHITYWIVNGIDFTKKGISMKKRIGDYLVIVLGLAIIAFAVRTLIAPNQIVQGGVSGLAIVIYYLSEIPISVSNLVINVLLILIGIRILGKEFIIKTLVCVTILSGFFEVFSAIPPLTNDRILASLFGGIIYGLGIGLTLIKGSSSGGTDIAGRITQHFFPYMSIGKLLLFIDGLVIFWGYIVFRDLSLVMYGIITLFVSTFSIDFLMKTLNVSKIVFVISEKGDLIVEKLIATSGRGVTIINVTGAYTNQKKLMLMCVLKEYEIPEFQKKVDEIDKEAFMVFSESQQIVGNGFRLYK